MKPSLLTIIFVILLCAGCRLPSSDLTSAELGVLDTLYTREIKQLRVDMDSICTLRQDSIRDRAVDSLVELQLIEIKKLITRQ